MSILTLRELLNTKSSIYSDILADAERSGADLIVIASHQPELSDYLLGSNAAKVVRHAKCDVYVVRS
ncbi:MAG: universal stress protein [Gammaproteobacteria bacterium]|nr:universal stress protein [Gammaproteobacteria bacterium]